MFACSNVVDEEREVVPAGGAPVPGVGASRGGHEGAIRQAYREDLVGHFVKKLLTFGAKCLGMGVVYEVEEAGYGKRVVHGREKLCQT